MPRTRYCLVVAVCLLVLPDRTLLAAQRAKRAQGGPIEVFVDRVEVTVVNVDVVATDRAGRPIADLTVHDFEVLEDGLPVKISHFSRIQSMRGVTTSGVAPVDRERQRSDDESGLTAPSRQPLEVVVFIDHLNTLPHDLKRITRQLESFLSTDLEAEDAVMLVSFDGGLHVEAPLSTDRQLLKAGLARAMTRDAYGIESRMARQQTLTLLRATMAAVEDGCAEQLLQIVDDYAGRTYGRVKLTLDALRAVVDSLAASSERKALLFATGGFPLRPGAEYFALVNTWCPRLTQQGNALANAQPLLRELAEHANSNRVTFFGLQAAAVPDLAAGENAAVRQIRQGNERDPLIRLARETGGRAVFATGDFGVPLRAIGDELTAYYSLGYFASSRRDGAGHAIEVRVPRPDVDIRYRSGYRDQTLSERLADRTLSALFQENQSNPHGVAVEVGAVYSTRRKKRFDVSLTIHIPLAEVTFLPSAMGPAGKLRLLFGVLDSQGRMSDLAEVPLAFAVGANPLDAVRRQSYVHEVPRISFRAGEQRVAVGIYDELSENASFIVRSFDIPGEGEAVAARR